MNSKEKFDGCMKVAEFIIQRGDERRQFEWRLTFGIWVLLAGAIVSVRAEQFSILVGVLILFLYARWLYSVGKRNAYDTDTAWDILRQANDYAQLGLPLGKPNWAEQGKLTKRVVLTNWSYSLQTFFTLGLVVLFYWLKVSDITLFSFEGLVFTK